jgi:hypothetical protein
MRSHAAWIEKRKKTTRRPSSEGKA